MKRFLLFFSVIVLVVMACAVCAESAGNWYDAPVITKVYEQSVGKLYLEWEGNAPVYQVYMDGNKVADSTLAHQTINIEKGSHIFTVYPLNEEKIDADTKIDINVDSEYGGGSWISLRSDLTRRSLSPGIRRKNFRSTINLVR